MMQTVEILAKIRKMAERKGGQPPGSRLFRRETGISPRAWNGDYWMCWSDAVREAGFKPNTPRKAYSHQYLMRCLADIARERGRFPTAAAIDYRHRRDASCPCAQVFSRRARKPQLVNLLWEFCRRRRGYQDVAELCEQELQAAKHTQRQRATRQFRRCGFVKQPANAAEWNIIGVVYLLKCARQYKIGHTHNLKRRQREIAAQNLGKIKFIHSIQTDDPAGLEAYWHKRFRDRRIKGEWFQLTRDDVHAFKLREFM